MKKVSFIVWHNDTTPKGAWTPDRRDISTVLYQLSYGSFNETFKRSFSRTEMKPETRTKIITKPSANYTRHYTSIKKYGVFKLLVLIDWENDLSRMGTGIGTGHDYNLYTWILFKCIVSIVLDVSIALNYMNYMS